MIDGNYRTGDVYRTLSRDSEVLKRYQGKCRVSEGDRTIDNIPFELAQRTDGMILLYIVDQSHFIGGSRPLDTVAGTTNDGCPVEIQGNLHVVNSTFGGSAASEILLRPSHVKVRSAPATEPARIEYIVTNFELVYPFQFRLPEPFPPLTIKVDHLPDYDRYTGEMKQVRLPRITARITVTNETEDLSALDIGETDAAIDTFCQVVSLLRGTKITWIRAEHYDLSDAISEVQHAAHVTKSYSTSAPIPASPFVHSGVGRRPGEPLLNALWEILPTYEARKDALRLPIVVDALIDAKSAGDFIESRAVKLCVTLEVLLSNFYTSEFSDLQHERLGTSKSKRLRSRISAVIEEFLTDEGVSDDLATRYKNRIGDPKRPTFREKLEDICSFVKLELTEEELSSVKHARDTLVHTGRFPEYRFDEVENPEALDLFDQYLQLMHVIDRLILKIAGYSGMYVVLRSDGSGTYNQDWVHV